jgi:hypothetical protein
MPDLLLSLFAGWPAIVAAVVLAMLGLARNNYRLLVWAALLAVPFSWYLSGFPVIRSPIFLLPLLVFGSAYFMSRGREMLAWLLGIPFFLAIILLLYALFAGTA